MMILLPIAALIAALLLLPALRRGAMLMVLVTLPAHAAEITFTPATGDVPSPERGFYRGLSNDFLKVTADDMHAAHAEGSRLLYATIRLDDFRKKKIDAAYLAKIDKAFASAADGGVKLIVRFTYNYPGNERDYLDAKDAKLSVVKTHIQQLAPLVAKNRSSIAVLQAGFVGAWGEAHTSSNKLDSDENKREVITALLAAMPQDLQILWRYPSDVMKWDDVKGVERVGLHNDCFLSSPTDVGTYDEDNATRTKQRAFSAALSARTYYMGETCGAEPEAIRASCADILGEGAEFHVSSLNRDYYEGFFEQWKKEDCYDEVSAKLGYRLQLVSAALDGGKLKLRIANTGWATPLSAWRLVVTGGDGKIEEMGGNGLGGINAGGERVFMSVGNVAAGKVCVAGVHPDGKTGNVRFGNADDDSKAQTWDGQVAAMCFEVE
jgi:hypothetical protein